MDIKILSKFAMVCCIIFQFCLYFINIYNTGSLLPEEVRRYVQVLLEHDDMPSEGKDVERCRQRGLIMLGDACVTNLRA